MPKTHCMYGTPEYRAWIGMHTRCYNPNRPFWARYGGRGIKVCDRWHSKTPTTSFLNFFEDMGRKPTAKHTLERLNNDADYSPSNCVWALESQQARNRSNTNVVEYDGRSQCLKDWAKELGVDRGSIYRRRAKGQTLPEIFAHYQAVGPMRCVALAVEED